MRSTPRRRSDASTSRRRLAGLPTRRGAFDRSDSSQIRPPLVKTYGRSASGRSRRARATTSSEWPRPYTAAVSTQLIPDSTACRIAATEWSSSWSPQAKAHPPPPIAQAPKPARVIVMSVCPKGTLVSVWLMPLCSARQVHLSNSWKRSLYALGLLNHGAAPAGTLRRGRRGVPLHQGRGAAADLPVGFVRLDPGAGDRAGHAAVRAQHPPGRAH